MPRGKEAVVFILDANPSMNLPYPAGSTSSRLDCAKKALRSMISELMIQSKQNEICVVVCKTATTSHHKIATGVDLEMEYGNDIPFPSLTELTDGVVRPTIDVLRRVNAVETVPDSESQSLKGDIVDALILGADAMYERTHKYKFRRKIVMITDAEHDVVMDVQQTLTILDALRDMECRLEVIGLEFKSSGDYSDPDAVRSSNVEVVSNPTGVTSETDMNVDENDEGDIRTYKSKAARETLLLSLTEKTGGLVMAASTVQQVLDGNKGKRIPEAMQYWFELRIAPGLAVRAKKFSLLTDTNIPTLKKEVCIVDADDGDADPDEDSKPKAERSEEQEQREAYTTKTLWVDEAAPDDIVDHENITNALPFGSTLIPVSDYDFEGIATHDKSQPWLEILGYMERDKIPEAWIAGPPYGIAGGDSQKSCAAISALAQALHKTSKVAIGSFLKVKSSSFPRLAVIFPLQQPHELHPMRLVAMQVPYVNEVNNIELNGLDDDLDEEKTQACDNLIDTLMLPYGELESGLVSNPVLRSWNQTLIERALDHECPIVQARTFNDDDAMVTPNDVLQRALPAIAAFTDVFPLEEKPKEEEKSASANGKRKVMTYEDYL